MKRVFATACCAVALILLVPYATGASQRRANGSQALLLALSRRIAEMDGTSSVSLYPASLPPGFDRSLPLPRARLLGSVVTTPLPNPDFHLGPGRFDVYYVLSPPGGAQHYVDRLQRAGWRVRSPLARPMSGFVPSLFSEGWTTFCREDAPTITVRYSTHEPRDLTLSVSRTKISMGACKGREPRILGGRAFSVTAAPVPDLSSPPGVSTSRRSGGLFNGASAVELQTKLALSGLLDAYSTQMTKAGWRAATPLVGEGVVTQSFSYTDDKHTWQAVMTIYRSQTTADTYYAFIDTAETDKQQDEG